MGVGPGPGPGRIELVDGPLDGCYLDIAMLSRGEIADGLALPTPGCAYRGGRSLYDVDPHRPGRLRWSGDTPPRAVWRLPWLIFLS